MGRKAKLKEKNKEANKKGADRMRRFKDHQEKPKQSQSAAPNPNLRCVEYWEKLVDGFGNGNWERKFYYYDITKKTEKFI